MEDNKVDTKLIESYLDNSRAIGELEEKVSVAIAGFKVELAERTQKLGEIKEELKNYMVENGIKKFEDDFISLTYIAPIVRISIDTKRLKEEKPELWVEFSKKTEVKDSVRITVK